MPGLLGFIFLITFIILSFFALFVVAAFGENLGLQIFSVPLLEVKEFCKHAVTTVTGHSWGNLFILWSSIDIVTCLRIIIYGIIFYEIYQFLKYMYHLFFTYMDRVRTLGTTGYIQDGTFSAKEIANQVQRRRQIGQIPPVYPNGWFGLIESHKLAKKQAVSISALGK